MQNKNQILAEGLLIQKNNNQNIEDKAIELSLMSKKLQRAEEELAKNNLALAEILLISAENLSKEVK